jgi:c-di-GMP-binding flagellar brake protein YcgR
LKLIILPSCCLNAKGEKSNNTIKNSFCKNCELKFATKKTLKCSVSRVKLYMKDRKFFRQNIESNETLKGFIQIHSKNTFQEISLYDISEGGACLILERESYIQTEKNYPIQIKKIDQNGKEEMIINVSGKKVWYLQKDFQSKEMQYVGISFSEEIDLKGLIE